MTPPKSLTHLYIWHKEQEQRYQALVQTTKANLPRRYLESYKHSLEAKAEFHARAAELLRPFTDQ